MTFTLGAVVWLLVAGLLLILPMRFQLQDVSLFWSEVSDAAHAPLFGLFALAMLRALDRLNLWKGRPRFWLYLVVLALTLTAGGLTELQQLTGPREASLEDFSRDALGGAAFLAVHFALDRRASLRQSWKNRLRAVLMGSSIVLLLVAFSEVATTGIAYLQRNRAFPRICDFDSGWEKKFVHVGNAALAINPVPQGWVRDTSDQVGCLTFWPARYSGLAIGRLYPDWTGYEQLTFDVFSALDSSVALVLRIDDVHHNNAYSDRFNREVKVLPGVNRIVIPLEDVSAAPKGRELDMKGIRSLALFAVQPADSFRLMLDRFHLERE